MQKLKYSNVRLSVNKTVKGLLAGFERLSTEVDKSITSLNIFSAFSKRLRYRIPSHVPEEQVDRYIKVKQRNKNGKTKN